MLVNRLLTTQAKDVMITRVIAVPPKMGLKELSTLFIENQISGAPVIDEERRLVGFVSQTDLVELELHSEDFLESRMEETGGFVQDIMVPEVKSLPETATLAIVLDTMCTERLHRVIIVDEQQQVSGIITTMDVLCYLRKLFQEGYPQASA
ncbi:CBS domain protein [Candidatus Moduliflexus flocculans]|uniref:CBS domain protein n=1 Tax=Candidatus Moduliflexus flocculans TaxID=1499966 RepID=A0A0S6VYA5_9BACT|nr:CBS domain protein [Candidatus Moduliflexus flocculans]